jgi:predicted signal transduction protein with EAL and GGDEF domain
VPILESNAFWNGATKKITEARQLNGSAAILVIDFEGLPSLDAIFGPMTVDSFVKMAASRLSAALKPEDLVACWGRYQVVCCISYLLSPSHAELAAYKVLNILSLPFQYLNREIMLFARIGVSIGSSGNDNVNELLRKANVALQHAFQERESLKIFAADMDELTLLEMDLIVDLERSIDESRIFLVYQPQVKLSSNQIMGTEALLRWTHPQRGPIWPERMIRTAERTALISKLTLWVLNTALKQAADFRKEGLNLRISINMSAHNLREADLVDLVGERLAIWGIPPEFILLELTETAIMQEHKQCLHTLRAFREMGIRIAMDDFGTGYSSMSLLGQLPIDELKIDISFIREMFSKPEHYKIVVTMIELGHAMGMQVVAEGVEDKSTFEQLRNLGCDLAQGHYIGYPLPPPNFIEHVKSYNK